MTETPPTMEEARPKPKRGPVQTAGLALLAYVAFNLLLPLVPPLPESVLSLLGFPSTAVFMLLQLWLIKAVVNLRLAPIRSFGMTLLFTAIFLTFVFYLHPHFSWPYAVNKALFSSLPLLMGLCILLGCTFLGNLLSRIIREPNVLLPVALVAMPIDYLGAMTSIGFTNTVVTNNPGIAQIVSVPVPSVGSGPHHGALHPIGFVGPGDILFMAFFFAVVLRLDMNVRGTFWWIYGLLTATMLFVLSPWGINIAALVPMGLAVLIANYSSFKLKREEVFATIYAAAMILILVTGFYFYAHSRFVKSDSQKSNSRKSNSPGAADAQPITPNRSLPRRNPAPGGPAANR